MKDHPVFVIKVEQAIPRRRDSVAPVLIDGLISSRPIGPNIKITHRSAASVEFDILSPWRARFFNDSGSIKFIEKGVSTELKLEMTFFAALLRSYMFHFMIFGALAIIDFFWGALISDNRLFDTGWVGFAVVVWPAIFWYYLKRRWRQKIKTYFENMLYLS